MLTAKNLIKKQEQHTIIKGISLSVAKGEIVAITGPSGAGKSTLLHLLGSLEQPTSGSVTVNKVSVFDLSPRKQAQFRNQEMGFVFQFHHLLPEFTALENVALPLRIAGFSKKNAEQKALEQLAKFGLSNRVNYATTVLSGGEQQRVAIARALINQPSLLFADEPTGNLDSQNASDIHELFLQLKKEFNQTIILVTHNEQLAAFADSIIHLKDGEIVA